MSSSRGAARALSGAWTVYQAVQSLEHASMARAQEARAEEQHAMMMQSMEQYYEVANYMRDPKASTILGAGRLAEHADLEAAGMFRTNGLYIGRFGREAIFYNGDRHALSYGRTRSGKGRDIILPVLGSNKQDSLIITDIKDGENAYATAGARSQLGHRIIALNPFKMAGIEGFRLNPCQTMIDVARTGYELAGEDQQFIDKFLPMTPKQAQSDGAWALEGAREILRIRAKYLAYFDRDNCNPAGLWHMVHGSDEHIRAQYAQMIACGDDSISRPAETYLHTYENADRQYAGYRTGLNRAVAPYSPGSIFAEETNKSDFDPADLKRERITVYAMLPADKIEVGAQWLALAISSMMETIAAATGNIRTTVIMDELANLPYMPIIPKALKLFAGKGVRLWGFCQGRHSLIDAGYTKETIREFEDQSGFLQLWEVEDTELLRDIESRSGKMGVATRSASMGGGGGLQGSFSISEQAKSVLQAEDIVAIGAGRQLLKVAGCPHFIVADRIPWFEYPAMKRALRDPRDITTGATDWKPQWQKRQLLLPAPAPEPEDEPEITTEEALVEAIREADDLREQLQQVLSRNQFEESVLKALEKALSTIAAKDAST